MPVDPRSRCDGLKPFLRDLEIITQSRTIDEIKFILGQGDFVFRGSERHP
jgi:hypothetical protein